jgi:hypothetical protein
VQVIPVESNAEVDLIPVIVEADATNIPDDPFLIFYLRNLATVIVDRSENVMTQRIQYKNFDTKEINYGDFDTGTFWYTIYLFEHGVFCGIDSVETLNGIFLGRYKGVEILRDTDGSISSIDQYVDRGRPSYHNVYKKIDNAIIANDGLRAGPVAAVIAEEESRYLYYNNYSTFIEIPDWPNTIIEFNDREVIVDLYDVNKNYSRIMSRFYFSDGILMKREYFGNQYNNPRIETYTISSGTGEIIVTNTDGTVIERRTLERRINDAGYLEYEAVRYPSGEGYEYFILKDTFK